MVYKKVESVTYSVNRAIESFFDKCKDIGKEKILYITSLVFYGFAIILCFLTFFFSILDSKGRLFGIFLIISGIFSAFILLFYIGASFMVSKEIISKLEEYYTEYNNKTESAVSDLNKLIFIGLASTPLIPEIILLAFPVAFLLSMVHKFTTKFYINIIERIFTYSKLFISIFIFLATWVVFGKSSRKDGVTKKSILFRMVVFFIVFLTFIQIETLLQVIPDSQFDKILRKDCVDRSGGGNLANCSLNTNIDIFMSRIINFGETDNNESNIISYIILIVYLLFLFIIFIILFKGKQELFNQITTNAEQGAAGAVAGAASHSLPSAASKIVAAAVFPRLTSKSTPRKLSGLVDSIPESRRSHRNFVNGTEFEEYSKEGPPSSIRKVRNSISREAAAGGMRESMAVLGNSL